MRQKKNGKEDKKKQFLVVGFHRHRPSRKHKYKNTRATKERFRAVTGSLFRSRAFP